MGRGATGVWQYREGRETSRVVPGNRHPQWGRFLAQGMGKPWFYEACLEDRRRVPGVSVVREVGESTTVQTVKVFGGFLGWNAGFLSLPEVFPRNCLWWWEMGAVNEIRRISG